MGLLLRLIHLFQLLFNPVVPKMEWNLLFFAFLVQLSGCHRENEVSVLFIVDDLQGEAAEPEVLLLWVLSAIFLPLLGDGSGRRVRWVLLVCRHFIHPF